MSIFRAEEQFVTETKISTAFEFHSDSPQLPNGICPSRSLQQKMHLADFSQMQHRQAYAKKYIRSMGIFSIKLQGCSFGQS